MICFENKHAHWQIEIYVLPIIYITDVIIPVKIIRTIGHQSQHFSDIRLTGWESSYRGNPFLLMLTLI